MLQKKISCGNRVKTVSLNSCFLTELFRQLRIIHTVYVLLNLLKKLKKTQYYIYEAHKKFKMSLAESFV